MTDQPSTVLVIGGGIGGIALGHALRAAGIDVQIYERHPDQHGWVSGYRLNINRTGSRSLHHCLPEPLWRAFTATSVQPSAGLAFRTDQLRNLTVVGQDVMTAGATDPADQNYAVSRTVLRNILLTGMDRIIHYGRTFERYERRADGRVVAYFTDGSTAVGDVLVAADGANSRVRQQYLPEAPRLDTDAVSVAGRLALTPDVLAWLPSGIANGMNVLLPSAGSFLFTSAFAGRRQMTTAIRAGHDLAGAGLDPKLLLDEVSDYVLWAFITHRRHYPANAFALDGTELRGLAHKLLRGWHPTLRRMVTETDPSTLGVLRLKRSTIDYDWTATPVTLLGDAVHNMPPVMGLGANTALRDAAELSAALAAAHRGELGLIEAISRYEAKLRDYGFGAVRESTKYTEAAISGNAVARHGMKAWLRLCDAVPSVKRRSFGPSTELDRQHPDLLGAAN
ncbi:MAG TPA: FAD-dependent monooxygenase [Pseudonocardiaceae bacterium]